MKLKTYSGVEIDLLNPKEEDILIEDIAHALANTCRFNGHVKRFYSVAEHSVLCANLIENKRYQLDALLHDASEAYLGDITRPLKALLPNYMAIEERFQRVIAKKFGLSFPMPKEVKEIDNRMLVIEAQQLRKEAKVVQIDFHYHEKVVASFLSFFKKYSL